MAFHAHRPYSFKRSASEHTGELLVSSGDEAPPLESKLSSLVATVSVELKLITEGCRILLNATTERLEFAAILDSGATRRLVVAMARGLTCNRGLRIAALETERGPAGMQRMEYGIKNRC